MLAGTGIPSIGLIRRLTCLRSQGCFSRRGTRARRESFTVTTLDMIPKGRLSIWSVKYLRTNTACCHLCKAPWLDLALPSTQTSLLQVPRACRLHSSADRYKGLASEGLEQT